MQPALNPDFTWTCWRIDNKTMCDGELHNSWTAADIGVPCAGGTIYSTGTQDQTLRRWGDADGLALHTHGHGDIRETLALNPEMMGTTARLFAHFSQRFLYGVPGDASTRVEVLSGNDITVVVPGTGLVIHDVGVKAFDIEGNLLFAMASTRRWTPRRLSPRYATPCKADIGDRSGPSEPIGLRSSR